MFKKYAKSTSGNMAIISVICASVLLLGMGAAIDWTQTAKNKQDLQNMVDNATLAAAKSRKDSKRELKAIVDDVISEHNDKNWPIKAKVTLKDDVVYVSATSEQKTLMMNIFGTKKMGIYADAASPLAQLIPLNMTLVLDTTDSMEGDNIRDLKVAAKAMITDLKEFDSPINMSVVPFGKYVNVGLRHKRAVWIDTSKDGTYDEYEHCYDEQRTIKARSCRGNGTYRTEQIVKDGRNRGSRRVENQTCEPGIYEPTGNRICEMKRIDYTWYGCAGSRDHPYNERAPYASRRIPGIMNETCGSEMVPLTSDLDKIERTIDGLTTSGETYIPSGIMWGWRTLDKAVPFTEIRKTYKKRNMEPTNVMVIMTDGENTLSQSSDGYHNDRDKNDANKRTETLCENAKDEDIRIFTVGYRMGAGRRDMEKLLKGCASVEADYFDADNAAELEKAFKDIVNRLNYTRLSM